MMAALCAALAVLLLFRCDRATIQLRLLGGYRHSHRRQQLLLIVAASVAAGLWAIGPKYLDWLAITAVMSSTIGYLIYDNWRRRVRRQRQTLCLQGVKTLASLLRSGLIPTAALESAAEDCAPLQSAAAIAHLGGDIGAELERVALLDGQQGMRSVAAAWKVSERSGAPIADVLALVAQNLRQQRQLDALIETELAAARTSGHMMAVLPFVAICLGFAVGINTAEFLVSDPLGRLLLLVGVSLTAVGVLWINRLSVIGARS